MFILGKQFSDKFNRLYTKSMNDNRKANDEYNELIKVYEDHKKNKKNKLSVFLKLSVFGYNIMFITKNISINIYH